MRRSFFCGLESVPGKDFEHRRLYNLSITVVGDKEAIAAELEALGMPVVEMDANGD